MIDATAVIDSAVATHNASRVFAMFSGGHDSLTATHIAAQHPKFVAAVHINTGIGIEQTRQFVRDTCEENGWPLLEYRATDQGQDYDEIVREHGFPGSNEIGHRAMYSRLKERPLRQLFRDYRGHPRERLVLVSGCRQQESTRRMGNVSAIQQDGRKVWAAPIWTWSKSDCNDYIAAQGLKRNEVVDLLHMSGECLCGAFATPDELDEIALWFPEEADRIRLLEAEVMAAGFPWRWCESPPQWWREQKRGQAFFWDMAPSCDMTMCQDCEARRAR